MKSDGSHDGARPFHNSPQVRGESCRVLSINYRKYRSLRRKTPPLGDGKGTDSESFLPSSSSERLLICSPPVSGSLLRIETGNGHDQVEGDADAGEEGTPLPVEAKRGRRILLRNRS